MYGRDNAILFYLPAVIIVCLPWTAFLVRAAWEVRKDKGSVSALQGKGFLWTWIVFIFVFFSLSSSKLIPYIAPIFIPLSVLIGNMLKNYDFLSPRPQKR